MTSHSQIQKSRPMLQQYSVMVIG